MLGRRSLLSGDCAFHFDLEHIAVAVDADGAAVSLTIAAKMAVVHRRTAEASAAGMSMI